VPPQDPNDNDDEDEEDDDKADDDREPAVVREPDELAFSQEATPHDPAPNRTKLEEAAGDGQYLFWTQLQEASVVGSIIFFTSVIFVAGKPLISACLRMMASSRARYTQKVLLSAT
jgi:hypothetical protein